MRIQASRRLAVFFCFLGFFICGLSAASRVIPVAPPANLSTTNRLIPVFPSANRLTAKVTLPPGTTAVVLQSRAPLGEWINGQPFAAQPGPLTLNLPVSVKGTVFRLKVTIEAVSRTKFPASFYRGRSSFPASEKAPKVDLNRVYMTASAIPMEDIAVPATSDAPVEADIWKISGTTAYFFNQLRGLQVIDLSKPGAPALVASVRMPAAGQDLYLLPSAEGRQDVLLVATELADDDSTTSTLLQIVRVSGGVARIIQTTHVAGYPQGSRLLGRRLFLCTTDWSAEQATLSDWLIPADGAPASKGQTPLAGSFGSMAAGTDWLAVAMTPSGQWNQSSVSAFKIAKSGLSPLTAAPVAIKGTINDQYKIQWRAGVLTTITQVWPAGGGAMNTTLENFQADGPAADGRSLGKLQLAHGEALHATRFAGDKAYIVTFRNTDPLFVVDLSDPANPAIAGQIEVPGWSTHIEPIGDKLFTVGWEAGAVTASLFDVSDPSAPSLLRRLALTQGYSYSEANWDPQALQVISEAGLAMVPLNTYGNDGAESAVRLIDIDLAGGDLKLRGLIPGRFEARRAALMGDVVVTISQRNLETATITNRDEPDVLADTLLAWPVDFALPAGDRVLAVEAGGSWNGGQPSVRTSPLTSPDSLLAELPLADGYIHDAVLRDGRLYVLRETTGANHGFIRFWMMSLGQLHLDVYDAADPLAPTLLGSCAWDASGSGASSTGRLLWPSANRPVVVLESRAFYWDFIPMVLAKTPSGVASVSTSIVSGSRIVAPSLAWPGSGGQPHLLAFDVTDPTAPTAGKPLAFGLADATLTELKVAAEGLVVVGVDQWRDRIMVKGMPATQSELVHAVQVIDVPASGAPGARNPIDLPGSLFAVSQLGRDGFLAYTRTLDDNGGGAFQVSVCDGRDAFEITQVAVAEMGAATAGDRTLFHVTQKGVQRRTLNDAGKWVADGVIVSKWLPTQMRVVDGQLLASDWRRLLAAPVDGKGASESWTFSLGFNLENVERADGGTWIVPMGDYGFELAAP